MPSHKSRKGIKLFSITHRSRLWGLARESTYSHWRVATMILHLFNTVLDKCIYYINDFDLFQQRLQAFC